MTNYSERLGLLIEAIVVREAAGTYPVTGEPHPCENRDETDGAAYEGCAGPEMAESRAARVGAIFKAARKQSKAAKKAAALKAKYLNPKTGAFKGKKGEKFKNCAAYMKAKGGVKDPKALCGSIARKKALGEAADPAIQDIVVAVVDRKLSMEEAKAALKEYGQVRVHPMATGIRKWFKLDAVAAGLQRLQRDKRFEVREAGEQMGEAAGDRDRMNAESLKKLGAMAYGLNVQLQQVVPDLLDLKAEMTPDHYADLTGLSKAVNRADGALTAIKAGFALRESIVGESVDGRLTQVMNTLERLETQAPAAIKRIRSSLEKLQADAARNAPQVMNAQQALGELQTLLDGLKRRLAQVAMEVSK